MTKPPLGLTARATVIKVVDGDTIDVELHIRTRIRMLGCWAPESRTLDPAEKKLGLAAKAHLSELTADGNGTVFIPTEDAHSIADVMTLDRLLGRFWMDGQVTDISTEQVVNGFASSTKGGKLGE
jgi:endonuclease YncB( thermonuclease family)